MLHVADVLLFVLHLHTVFSSMHFGASARTLYRYLPLTERLLARLFWLALLLDARFPKTSSSAAFDAVSLGALLVALSFSAVCTSSPNPCSSVELVLSLCDVRLPAFPQEPEKTNKHVSSAEVKRNRSHEYFHAEGRTIRA